MDLISLSNNTSYLLLGLSQLYRYFNHVYQGNFSYNSKNVPVIDNGQRKYCISKQYFRAGINIPLTTITVVGDIKVDKDGILWIVPNNYYFSGIYTTKHPISWMYWIYRDVTFILNLTVCSVQFYYSHIRSI